MHRPDNTGGLRKMLKTLNDGKVDKITGKGLSKNDYSDAEKAALASASTSISQLTAYSTVAAVDNEYPIDLNNQPNKNVRVITADNVAKTFLTPTNVPTDCELLIALDFNTACAITWFANISWLNGTPLFVAGQKYILFFFTHDGGATWQGGVIGGWA